MSKEHPNDEPIAHHGLIIRQKEPVNLEMPFSGLDGCITPSDQFYVRCHFPIPEIAREDWKLRVDGEVERPLELDLDALRQMEARTVTATLECAGNSRIFLVPQKSGAQWELGAVGTAEWTGVPLLNVLERVGLKQSAIEIVLEGADQGQAEESHRPAGKIHFGRSLPREKALKDVLLAWQMNGKELSAAHGFPLRAIVPGWYGMASVKWLTRITATAQPYNGYFQTIDYSIWQRHNGFPTLVPISELQVKAAIARPSMREIIPAASTYRVHGAAWTADAEIAKVEISIDAGATWHEARLSEESLPKAWRLWEYEWLTPEQPGKYTVMARATDSKGRIQPAERDEDLGSYVVHHCLPVEVEVR